MKTLRILTRLPASPFRAASPALSIGLLLLMHLPAHAVTDTWDGGGTDNLINTNNNWMDNSAPVSSLANTDLIFAGTVRLTPNFADLFQVDSITFSNTAGAFNLTGLPLNIGTTGVIDNDTDTQTFSLIVIVGTPTTTINAASGGLNFAGGLFPNGNSVTCTGAGSLSMSAFNGGGSLTKSGAGTLSIAAGGSAIIANMNLNAGTTQITATGTTQTISSTVTVGGGTIAFNENTIFNGGAQLNRSSGFINVASGKTVTFQGGSDFNFLSPVTFDLSGTVVITGAGSQMTSGAAGGIHLRNNAALRVLSGGLASFTGLSVLNIAVGSNGTMLVDGLGSTLNVGRDATWGAGGNATVTFSNEAVANVQGVTIADSSSTSNVQILSGADVNQTGNLVLGGSMASANLTISGTGSTWTQLGNVFLTIGNGGELNVASGGTFTAQNSAAALVNPNGRLHVAAAGTFNAPGGLTVTGNSAEFLRDATGVFNIDAGRTLRVESNAHATFTGDFATNGAHLLTTGTGSLLTCTGTLTLANGSSATVNAGTTLDVDVNLRAGTAAGSGTVVVTGSGATLTAAVNTWGAGGAGNLTLSSGATGTFGTTLIGSDAIPDSVGVAQVLSGATVTSGNLSIGSTATSGTSGSLTIDGAGSMWTLNGAATLTVGAASTSTASLAVSNGGVFNAGTGAVNVNPTGTITINGGTFNANGDLLVNGGQLTVSNGGVFNGGTGAVNVNPTGAIAINGGTFNANGDLLINGGQLTRSATGTLTFEPGKTVTVQNGGDVTITGNFTNAGISGTATITVTGAGSTFTTTGDLTLNDGSDTQVLAGATLSTGGFLRIANGTDVVVDGSGSSLSNGLAVFVGSSGGVSTLTFTNGSTGTFTTLAVARTNVAGTTGALHIQSGADVTCTRLLVGGTTFVNSSSVTISGAGSTLTVTGSETTVIGAANTSTGTLTVENGGTFITGTGDTTVDATGDLNINAGGTMIVRGNMTVANSLDIASGGTVILSGGAPAPGEFVEAAFSAIGEGDVEMWESGASAATVPEPGVGALLAGALALLAVRRPKERRFPSADPQPARASAAPRNS